MNEYIRIRNEAKKQASIISEMIESKEKALKGFVPAWKFNKLSKDIKILNDMYSDCLEQIKEANKLLERTRE